MEKNQDLSKQIDFNNLSLPGKKWSKKFYRF